MAVKAGFNGNFAITSGAYSTVDGEIFEWSFNMNNDEYDSTTFATSGDFHTFELGLATARGTARGYLPTAQKPFDDATDFTAGRSSGTLTLTSDSGETITITPCHFNNMRITVNKQQGLNAIEFDFVGTVSATATA